MHYFLGIISLLMFFCAQVNAFGLIVKNGTKEDVTIEVYFADGTVTSRNIPASGKQEISGLSSDNKVLSFSKLKWTICGRTYEAAVDVPKDIWTTIKIPAYNEKLLKEGSSLHPKEETIVGTMQHDDPVEAIRCEALWNVRM